MYYSFQEVKIEILGDKVNDAGGLLREWMLMCMKEILHPNTGRKMKGIPIQATNKPSQL